MIKSDKILLISLVCLLGCREERAVNSNGSPVALAKPPPSGSAPPRVAVQTHGELRAMMHEEKTGPVVNLRSVSGPTSYALGALSELRGEVTILNGTIWLAYPGEGNATRVEATPSSGESAALLVAAKVASWRDVPVPQDTPWNELERRVEALAKSAGVDVEAPFPLLLEGELTDLRWHVIDGRRATPGPSSHQQHLEMAVKGEASSVRAVLLGFFSKQHQGIFTHHGENIHFHVVDAARKVTGHVDAVGVKQGAVLRLPG